VIPDAPDRRGTPEARWGDLFRRLQLRYAQKRFTIAQKMVNRRIGFASSKRKLRWKGRLLLFYFGFLSKNHKVLPLEAYAKIAHATVAIAESTPCSVFSPSGPGLGSKQNKNFSPDINACIFQNVLVNPKSSSIGLREYIGVPEIYITNPKAIIADYSYLLWQGEEGVGLVRSPRPTNHNAGVRLFGSGSTNWYHWLIETLPAAFLSKRLPPHLADLPLVVPVEIYGFPTFRESLELFRDGRDLIALAPGMHRFQRLVIIDSLVSEPMNTRTGHWPDARDYAYNSDLIRQYRDAIQDRLGVARRCPDDRIFLARENGRRTYNQDELLAVAERYGFRAVHAERLTFRQQVETLTNAACVVGPSGAAFANTLFCQKGTRLLSWLPPQYKGFCSYMNIATVTQSKLRYLFSEPDQPIRNSHDAYVASYRVDISEFEAALQMALKYCKY
jgi:capsular polysaccharide biosynthesis protein